MRTFRKILLLLLLSTIIPALADTLSVGDTVPDFTLVNQNGEKTSLSDFKNKGVVLSFLYTSCPYPSKCPMIGRKLSSLAELTQKVGSGDELQVVAITLDPKNDTPEALKAYAQGFDESHRNWMFLTGSEQDVAKIAGGLGVVYWDQDGVIQHNMKTVYIDPQRRIQIVKSGSDWRPGEFAAEIQRMKK